MTTTWGLDRNLKPMMRRDELALLQQYATDRQLVVEFGCGGSTGVFLQAGARVISIESDKAWVRQMKAHYGNADGRLDVRHANIGPTGLFGRPVELSNPLVRRWGRYWSDVWRDTCPGDVDLVFVDGRFRVACALNAALRCPLTPILVHDFSRQTYQVLLEHMTLVERVADMAVLMPGGSLCPDIVTDLAAYAADWR